MLGPSEAASLTIVPQRYRMVTSRLRGFGDTIISQPPAVAIRTHKASVVALPFLVCCCIELQSEARQVG